MVKEKSPGRVFRDQRCSTKQNAWIWLSCDDILGHLNVLLYITIKPTLVTCKSQKAQWKSADRQTRGHRLFPAISYVCLHPKEDGMFICLFVFDYMVWTLDNNNCSCSLYIFLYLLICWRWPFCLEKNEKLQQIKLLKKCCLRLAMFFTIKYLFDWQNNFNARTF